MNPYHGRASARPEEPITAAILRGDAWTARRIRSNCLRQHCHVLVTAFLRPEFDTLRALCARVLSVLESRSLILTQIHPKELSVIAAVARICAYAPLWLRQPEDWWPDQAADAQRQWADFLRHLFARYAVPAFLDSAWSMAGSLEHFDRDCWCAIAQGRSLRTVPGFPGSVPHRVLHVALTISLPCPTDDRQGSKLAQSIWHSQLRILNATPALEAAVMASRIPSELGNYALWSRLVAKFAAAGDEKAGRIGFVANTLSAARAYRGGVQVERLMRLPLRTLLRHCHRFVTSLIVAQGHSLEEPQIREAVAKGDFDRLFRSRWAPLFDVDHSVGTPTETGQHSRWLVEELCTLSALQEEGRVMEHCVQRYASRCRSGRTAIFSVRRRETMEDGQSQMTSFATIEVVRQAMKIVQIRAYRNLPVNNTIRKVVQDWAVENNLICTI